MAFWRSAAESRVPDGKHSRPEVPSQPGGKGMGTLFEKLLGLALCGIDGGS